MVKDAPAAAGELLAGLREVARRQSDAQVRRRETALDNAHGALRALDQAPTPSAILERVPAELGRHSVFPQVLLTTIRADRLAEFRLWESGPPELSSDLSDAEVSLSYPLVEAELVQAGSAQLVRVADNAGRTPALLHERLRWSAYICAAVALGGQRRWMIHAELRDGEPDPAAHVEALSAFASGLGRSLELAAMRALHRAFRAEQLRIANAVIARVESTSIAALAAPEESEEWDRDDLTPREHQVVALLIKGMTNAAIAGHLMISEGTVKYHVANVLRKVGATTRADAVARYMKEQMRDAGP